MKESANTFPMLSKNLYEPLLEAEWSRIQSNREHIVIEYSSRGFAAPPGAMYAAISRSYLQALPVHAEIIFDSICDAFRGSATKPGIDEFTKELLYAIERETSRILASGEGVYGQFNAQFRIPAYDKLIDRYRAEVLSEGRRLSRFYSSKAIVFIGPSGSIPHVDNLQRIEPPTGETKMKNPTVFISYSWDNEGHKQWVRDLAARMRADGIDLKLDQWEAVPGDQLPRFMEQSIRENDFVLVICTPQYKRKSDNREGGVGYEGDIMTAEVHTIGNHRKFIPVMRQGPWIVASPSWLSGKYRIDLTGEPYSEKGYDDLLATLYGIRDKAPPLGPVPTKYQMVPPSAPKPQSPPDTEQQDIKIKGIVIDEVTEPRWDGTPGSALYQVPFQLSKRPSPEWIKVFLNIWNNPPQFTTMHRPGIAKVIGDKIVLDGTTIEEVQQYHRETLVLVVDRTNARCQHLQQIRQHNERKKEIESEEHKKKIRELSKNMNFE